MRFMLQRLAFRDTGWFTIITSQLASNAFSRVVPGGAAAGGALQFRMLKVAGTDTRPLLSTLLVKVPKNKAIERRAVSP